MKRDINEYYKSIKGKNVFFLGAGISHRQLIVKYASLGAKVTLCDAKSESELEDYLKELSGVEMRTVFGNGYLDNLPEADIIFRTPGIDYTKASIQAAVAAGKTVTSEIEMFFEYCPCKIIGITGSDGKTTTSSLIAAVLEKAGYTVHLGGNIGRPLFPMIDEIKEDGVAVVELSSFQLISMRRSPDIAVVTNVTPNHLDHHKDMEEYIGAKRNILLFQDKRGVAVLNADNAVTREMTVCVKGELRGFGRGRGRVKNGVCIENNTLYAYKDGAARAVMDLGELSIRGEHNKENTAAAYCAVVSLVSDEVFRKAASEFQGVEHRIEFVRETGGIRWYNDSIATSPTRTAAGLRSFDEKIILIAGGSDKGLSYEKLAEEIAVRVKRIYLSGPTAAKIYAAVLSTGADIEIIRTNDVEESVAMAAAAAKDGDTVMLSPASPSFDSYRNFEERGRHFKRLVNAL